MLTLGVILSTTTVLTTLATFIDKFYTDPERDDRWRTWLISLYVYLDDNTHPVTTSQIKENFGIALATFVPFVFSIYIAYLYLKYVIPWILKMFGIIGIVMYLIASILDLPRLFLIIVLMLSFPALLLVSAYGTVRLGALVFIGTATAPKNSPVAFTVALVGIAVALGKLAIDVAKATST